MYDGQPDSNVVWSGSTNFSALGFSSDDMTVRTMDAGITQAYFRDWGITWNGPDTHRPHAGLANPEARRNGGEPSQNLRAPLGQGYYRALEAD